jgi:hypothetical protein
MEIQIEVSVNDYQRGNGQLRLSERVSIPRADFGMLAEILGKFHELLAVIKEAKAVPDND